MVKDSSVTSPVNPTAEIVGDDYRKGITHISKKTEISNSLFLNFMVYKKGIFNCRRTVVLIVADQISLCYSYPISDFFLFPLQSVLFSHINTF
jgi:hypothetical protein